MLIRYLARNIAFEVNTVAASREAFLVHQTIDLSFQRGIDLLLAEHAACHQVIANAVNAEDGMAASLTAFCCTIRPFSRRCLPKGRCPAVAVASGLLTSSVLRRSGGRARRPGVPSDPQVKQAYEQSRFREAGFPMQCTGKPDVRT
jgi:hypothetical protein